MATSPISASSDPQSSLGMQDFLKILLTQLNYQDPLKPMDNQAFLAQMAQFSSLEQTRQLTERIDRLLGIQATSQSVGLIGRTVEISTASGSASGQVMSLNLTGAEPELSLKLPNGQVLIGISLTQVLSVS